MCQRQHNDGKETHVQLERCAAVQHLELPKWNLSSTRHDGTEDLSSGLFENSLRASERFGIRTAYRQQRAPLQNLLIAAGPWTRRAHLLQNTRDGSRRRLPPL